MGLIQIIFNQTTVPDFIILAFWTLIPFKDMDSTKPKAGFRTKHTNRGTLSVRKQRVLLGKHLTSRILIVWHYPFKMYQDIDCDLSLVQDLTRLPLTPCQPTDHS